MRQLLACAAFAWVLFFAAVRAHAADQAFSKGALAAVGSLGETPIQLTLTDTAIQIRDRDNRNSRKQSRIFSLRKTDTPVNLQIPYASLGRLSDAPLDRRRVASGGAGLPFTGVAAWRPV